MKILFVEDQLAFANMIVNSLEGLPIYHVESLSEAKEWLRKNRADLILIDLGLTDSQGLDTLRAFKDCRAPKVVISGRYDIVSKAYESGANDYIVKTTPLPDLLDRIMFNVEKARPRKRFSDSTFIQIKACFEAARPELTYA